MNLLLLVNQQSKLIPRWLSGWGLVGSIPHIVWGFLALFGLDFGILMFPLALLEMVLAVWLIVFLVVLFSPGFYRIREV